MTVKAGYKGSVYIGAVKIGGVTVWSYGGGVRQMQAKDQLGDEVVTDLPLQIVGGDITITGNYLMHSDAGQQLLKTLWDSAEPITDLKLFISDKGGDNIYKTPDDTTDPPSYATVTNYDNISDDKSGIGTFTATLKMSGKLKPMGGTETIQVETIGVHGITDTAAEFVGNLISMGGVTPVVCYFEYGETILYGETTTPTDSMTAVGLFGEASGLLVTATLYHYRAVAIYDEVEYYGKDKTFTTL